MVQLTEKELKFCLAYHACNNGTEAYLYAANGEVTRESAATQSYDWLNRVEIQDKLTELRDIEACRQQILIHQNLVDSLKAISLITSVAEKLVAVISKKIPDETDPNYQKKVDKLRPSELKSIASAMTDCVSLFREIRTLQLEFSGVSYLIENADKLVKKEVFN